MNTVLSAGKAMASLFWGSENSTTYSSDILLYYTELLNMKNIFDELKYARMFDIDYRGSTAVRKN